MIILSQPDFHEDAASSERTDAQTGRRIGDSLVRPQCRLVGDNSGTVYASS
jgi:hypothetical protein